MIRTFPAISRVLLGLSAQRYLPRSLYDRFPKSITRDLFRGGMRLYNAPYKLYVPFEIVEDLCEFEPITQQVFTDSVKPGMTVVDVGANVGYCTLLAGKLVGPSGKVHAVEPCADNLAFLERNIKSSKLRNIVVHPCAVGELRRQRIFHVTDIAVDHGFYPHPYANTVRTMEVPEVPLDQLIKSPIHFVKIDVEGAEIEVLSGMTSTLDENDALSLIVEWSPDCQRNAGRDPSELPSRLQSLGFKRIDVLEDIGKQVTSVDDVLRRLSDGQLPKFWHSNLWARKR